TCRDLVEDREWLKALAFPPAEKKGDDGEADAVERAYTVEVSGRRFDVKVIGPPAAPGVNGAAPAAPAATGTPPRARRAERSGGGGGGGGGDTLVSPIQGNMWKVLVEQGQTVEEGQIVCIIEAMKMENEITAHKAGVVSELPVQEGEPITSGATIAV